MNDNLKRRLAAEQIRMEKKYGHKAAALGSAKFKLNVVPTGVLALDYALGIGGWPLGHPVEIFGAPDIGKSSVLGLGALRSAQAMGLTCGIVALEPAFDKEWAIKHGVDPEWLIIGRPDDGVDAFNMVFDWVTDDLVDFILFDSVGALLRPSEIEGDKKEGTQAAYGQSGLITWGVKRLLMPTWKNNKGLVFLNQIRDDTNSRIAGQVESPGGWALKHSAAVRVHLKSGREKETASEGSGDNKEDIIVGRQLVASIKRNKLSEGTNRKATFWFYQRETDKTIVGIDAGDDILNTGLRTQVIERKGAYYSHRSFPLLKDENKIQGKDSVSEFLAENPDAVQAIRDDVIAVMLTKAGKPKTVTPDTDIEGDED